MAIIQRSCKQTKQSCADVCSLRGCDVTRLCAAQPQRPPTIEILLCAFQTTTMHRRWTRVALRKSKLKEEAMSSWRNQPSCRLTHPQTLSGQWRWSLPLGGAPSRQLQQPPPFLPFSSRQWVWWQRRRRPRQRCRLRRVAPTLGCRRRWTPRCRGDMKPPLRQFILWQPAREGEFCTPSKTPRATRNTEKSGMVRKLLVQIEMSPPSPLSDDLSSHAYNSCVLIGRNRRFLCVFPPH